MMKISAEASQAVAVVSAIRSGDLAGLRRQLDENPELGKARIVDDSGAERTLLHVAADWPGHFPNGPEIVALLIAAGADPSAQLIGPHSETPLHWAASNDDVAVLDALLDGGADIEAPGAIFTDGTPMSDAVIFAQWRAAHRLLERGARTTIWQAAALGLLDRVKEHCVNKPPPSLDQVTNAFWAACRGGQRQTAEYLLERGADLNWVGYDRHTPLQAALETGDADLITWLRNRGGVSAEELA